jgi:pimeloyl-ACP methyl ester carboxylesterase
VHQGYAASLAADPTTGARYVRDLVGAETWMRLSDDERARVADDAWVVAAEVPGFLAFAPAAEELDGLRELGAAGRLATSVGARSPAARHEAAAVLQRRAGVPVHVVPAAGHLPQVDNPGAFADLITTSFLGVRA